MDIGEGEFAGEDGDIDIGEGDGWLSDRVGGDGGITVRAGVCREGVDT